MIANIYKELIIVVLVFLGIWFGISVLKPQPDHLDEFVSIEKEQELGDALHRLQSLNKEVENDTILDAVYKIAGRLLTSMGLTNYDYQIHVVSNSQVNAYATMGGHVYILTGLLEEADSAEEVAAVLAHEIGHIEERHVINRLIKQLGTGVLFTIATGGDPSVIAEIMSTSANAKFSRGQESEADDFAFELMEEASINPVAMASIFKKIKKKYGGFGSDFEFLMSHPNINKRIKESIEYPVGDDFEERKIDIDWKAVKRNL